MRVLATVNNGATSGASDLASTQEGSENQMDVVILLLVLVFLAVTGHLKL